MSRTTPVYDMSANLWYTLTSADMVRAARLVASRPVVSARWRPSGLQIRLQGRGTSPAWTATTGSFRVLQCHDRYAAGMLWVTGYAALPAIITGGTIEVLG
jgi:hypothetical protein